MENVNRGAIFKNDSKQKETHPDYRGKINWGGVDIEISMWIKESKEGKKYFSVSLQEPYKKMENTSDKIARANKKDYTPLSDLDMPF